MAKICGDGKRLRTRAFTELVSHYLFADRFGRPGEGNDKGKVEGLVKYARANFMTPVPEAASFDALNAGLAEWCPARQSDCAGKVCRDYWQASGGRSCGIARVARGSAGTVQEARGAGVLDIAGPLSQQRLLGADGFRDVVVNGFVDQVVILRGGAVMARHQRAYGAGDFVADPLHYLALISRSRTRWTRQRRCRAGICRRCSSTCAIYSRRGWGTAASASSSRCCG